MDSNLTLSPADMMTENAATDAIHSEAEIEERPVWPAVRRGLQRLCPSCGKAHMFTGYLKVIDTCPVCRETLSHHRADDGPAYLTILIVGHILAIAMHVVWSALRPDPWVMASGFTIGTVALSLFLLPRMKGMVVAVQWAKRMHGFGKSN